MQIINVEQRSPAWFKLREKRMTASHAQAISANGKGLITYTTQLMQEYYSNSDPDHFENRHTRRGNELEGSAAFVYSMETGKEVQKVGFVIHDEFSGCSPDLFVSEKGMAEIKCPDDKAYFQLLIDGKIETKYVWQMQMQMMICDREWCDFVAYNPNFEKEIIIIRVEPDQKSFEKLNTGISAGTQMINDIETKMKGVLFV